jgi:AraC-like DNA-binding protein
MQTVNHSVADGGRESRTKVLDLSVGFLEDLRRSPGSAAKGPEGFCSDFQICLPYTGIFVWHVGTDDVVGDANQIVFVRGGEAFRMSSSSKFGYGELVVTPEMGVLTEIARAEGRHLFEHPLFKRRTSIAEPAMQAARAWFCHWISTASPRECLEAEEALIALIRAALQPDVQRLKLPRAGTALVVRRAKEVLQARLTDRLRLADISKDAGASPAYLTDLFTRTEGIPLHRYLTRLRLARALIELPHANDLTTLALDLGFSSHSHFTYAFRREFGHTPSEFRAGPRRPAHSDNRERPHWPRSAGGRMAAVPGNTAPPDEPLGAVSDTRWDRSPMPPSSGAASVALERCCTRPRCINRASERNRAKRSW